MKKVSIIVPIYNSEKYLERCLVSIQKQTYENLEILLMNDGSIDDSKIIAKKFTELDSRFKYYEHTNIGQGLTRNRGIELSSGYYLSFVDSDDYIDREMIENLVIKISKTKTDVVCGQLVKVYPTGKEEIRRSFKHIEKNIITDVQTDEFYKNYYFTGIFTPNPVDKLYKASVIKQNNIKFGDNSMIYAEDRFFQLQLLLYISSISFISKNIYFYKQIPGSTSHKYEHKIFKKQLKMVNDYQLLTKTERSEKVASLLSFYGITLEINNIVNSNLKFKDFKKSMSNARNNKYFANQMSKLLELKSYNLISNKRKKYYTMFVSFLEKNKLGGFSTIFIYTLYSFRKIKLKNRLLKI